MNLCTFPKCRQESSIAYLDQHLCAKHWTLLAEFDSVTNLVEEQRFLADIGLRRTEAGDVLEIER